MSSLAPELLIRLDDLSDPRIAVFLEEHMQDMRSASPPECVHALDLAALRQPGISFWSAWLVDEEGAETLAGTAAIKRLDEGHAELKSMRTAATLRGRGLARAMLVHVQSQARLQGFRRLSLETGPQPFFAPARGLYQREGFLPCPPFGSYEEDPYSYFMSIEL
jgi:putative acetyltransferase